MPSWSAPEKPAGPAPVRLVADDERTPGQLAAQRSMEDAEARRWMEKQARERAEQEKFQEEERRRAAEKKKYADDERARMKANMTPLG